MDLQPVRQIHSAIAHPLDDLSHPNGLEGDDAIVDYRSMIPSVDCMLNQIRSAHVESSSREHIVKFFQEVNYSIPLVGGDIRRQLLKNWIYDIGWRLITAGRFRSIAKIRIHLYHIHYRHSLS